MTTKENIIKILNIFKRNNRRKWIYGGHIERMDILNRDNLISKPSTIHRRLQELAENKEIKKSYDKFGYVRYKL